MSLVHRPKEIVGQTMGSRRYWFDPHNLFNGGERLGVKRVVVLPPQPSLESLESLNGPHPRRLGVSLLNACQPRPIYDPLDDARSPFPISIREKLTVY